MIFALIAAIAGPGHETAPPSPQANPSQLSPMQMLRLAGPITLAGLLATLSVISLFGPTPGANP